MAERLATTLSAFACDVHLPRREIGESISRALANCLGLMIGACDHPAARSARRALVLANAAQPAVSVFGMRRRFPLSAAVISNGISAHVEDFDDTSLPSILHPSAPIIPAALAAAELSETSGRDFTEACLAGVEIAIRVADGVTPRALDRGWHITGLIGPIGAAAAVGRIIGLDVPQMSAALSIAASQGGGIQAALGTMTKSLHPGRAALNGFSAAHLAAAGVTAPAAVLDSGGGIGKASADHLDAGVVMQGLGTEWRAAENLPKPYACGVVSHPAIAAAQVVRGRRGGNIAANDIVRVEARVNPLVLAVMGIRDPRTSLRSKFSIYHSIAVGLLDGRAGVPQFTQARARAADVDAVRRRIIADATDNYALDEVGLVVTFSDGRAESVHLQGVTMTREDIWDKVHDLAASRLGDRGVSTMLEQVQAMADLSSMAGLIDSSCGRLKKGE